MVEDFEEELKVDFGCFDIQICMVTLTCTEVGFACLVFNVSLYVCLCT
jgi:hypothetical protein